LASAIIDGKTGFINTKGKVVIKPTFDNDNDFVGFSEGLARVRVDRKYGYINKDGHIVIPPQFVWAHSFSEGLASVGTAEGKVGYIDKTGKMVLEPRVDVAYDFSDGLARVGIPYKSDSGTVDRYGFINKAGNIVIKIQSTGEGYGLYWDFSHRRALVWVPGKDQGDWKYGYIDIRGQLAIPLQFERARGFSEGLASVAWKGKGAGYINTTGETVFTHQFAEAGDFSEGLAVVRVGGAPGKDRYKYGYIDKTGSLVIQPQFDGAGDFSDGLAAVFQQDRGQETATSVDSTR
jgi:hypothetical protein